ncbi:hypothetical protein CENSYa_1875 [Cenarchaeum symbiosum A]|uniref:CARDB domain-containing protein n=1 Tax=Cenarchaeum symbiosum (strain A) TaxID=414004 RepID=A0RYR7_CENSY|nr:hypothetical protein CENSYa_1875 [Cenarchaeum symbiosum A]
MVLACLSVAGLAPQAAAETIKQTVEGGMDVSITYPGSAVAGRDLAVSFLVENNGWEDKDEVVFRLSTDGAIDSDRMEVRAGRVPAGGSYGETVDLAVLPGASPGVHFLNVEYSQVLLENNETPREPARTSIAVPIDVRDRGRVSIETSTPGSIFAGAEFPFTVSVTSDEDLDDVSVRLVPPADVGFRGETLHTFSYVEKGSTLGITSRIVTEQEEVLSEHRVPFQVVVSYTDGAGEQREDSQTVTLVLRPRTFMELTTDGGIWIGDFFVAPYVSIGTIIGIPAGALLSLMFRRRFLAGRKEAGT